MSYKSYRKKKTMAQAATYISGMMCFVLMGAESESLMLQIVLVGSSGALALASLKYMDVLDRRYRYYTGRMRRDQWGRDYDKEAC